MSLKPEARLFVESDLAAGQGIALSADHAHDRKNVLRLKEGDTIALFNGRDGEFRAAVESLGRNKASVAVLSQSRAQTPESDLWLVFAPIKRAR